MTEFTYCLAETVIRVSGRLDTITDEYPPPPTDDPSARNISPSVQTTLIDARIEVVHVADPDASRTVTLHRGDRSIAVTYTADTRLKTASYNSSGIGSVVVSTGAKLVGFVGSLALAAARLGVAAGGDPAASEVVRSFDPRADWEQAHPDEAKAIADARVVVAEGRARVIALRRALFAASGPSAVSTLAAQSRLVEAALATASADLARLEELYAVWRAARRSSVSASFERRLRVRDIPTRAARNLDPPDPLDSGGMMALLWQDCGLLLEREDPSGAAAAKPVSIPSDCVVWRRSRSAVLWVWRRGADEGPPELVSVAPIRVVDRESPLARLELSTAIFGNRGGTLEFADDGSPTALGNTHESAVGAALRATGDAPTALAGAVAAAKGLADDVSSLADAGAERRRDAANRDLETARARLELAGVQATTDDYAALKRAEQRVALDAAETTAAHHDAGLDSVRSDLAVQAARVAAEQVVADLTMKIGELQLQLAALAARSS